MWKVNGLYRLVDVANYFHQLATEQGFIIVVRDRNASPLNEGLELIFMHEEVPILLMEVDLGTDLSQFAGQLASQSAPVFFVIDRSASDDHLTDIQGLVTLTPVANFPKPNHIRQFEIYQVTLN